MTTSYSKALSSAFQASYHTFQMPTFPGFIPDPYVVGRDQAIGFQQYSDRILPPSPPMTAQTMMQPTSSPPSSSTLMFPAQGQFWSDASSGGTPGSSSGMPSVTELTGSFQERMSLSDPTHVLPPPLPASEFLTRMEAPDSMIGSILGRGGKVLNRIQSSTQTRIRLSQRGVFVPGTTNRIITITGTTSESVEHAMAEIKERLTSAEENKH